MAKQGSGGFKSSAGTTFGPLEQVFDDIWWAWGTVRFAPGITFPRNMTIVRENGELVVIHPVMMPAETQAKIEALGPIKHIIRLGAFHGMDDAKYVEKYAPTVWMPPECDHTLTCKTTDLVPGGALPLAGASLFDYAHSKTPETAIHLERHGGVLLTCDSIQNWETATGCSVLGKLMAKAMGFRGRAVVGPGWRKQCEPKDGPNFKPHFDELLAKDFRHLLSAHGRPIKDTARDDLRAMVTKIYG